MKNQEWSKMREQLKNQLANVNYTIEGRVVMLKKEESRNERIKVICANEI